ncbi:helix-turn-helix domain-containing protein [Nocardia transvalensis]|uniref:AraC-like ligand-binding domain-containing protein n=1 Tax=Nocardia transvalensis TaxID=37333 RepID=UPI00189418B9|nr:helix-turn-helix domain-containing protein [Nocardia transvalensis]MBF6329703.1 helix-turn-helix domain-containing protein [Nocardia transvalensis]
MKYGIDSVESHSTHDVALRERTDYWAELVQSHMRTRVGYAFPRRDFHGRTVRRRTANHQMIGWRADAVTYYRTPGHVRAASDDDYRLMLPTTGHITIWQDGQDVPMSPGSGCLVTVDQPVAYTQVDGTAGFTMTIPRREIDHRLGGAAPPARLLDFTTGLGRIVVDLATGLVAEIDTLTRAQFDAVSDRLVDLLCMHIVGDHPTERHHLADVESAVRQYIRAHAHEPELTGASVARALGWSLRQIQVALQRADTTPRELIKEERLRLAYARLQNPAYRRWSIGDIAHGLGFGSASAFSTAFRGRFGASPREIRRS